MKLQHIKKQLLTVALTTVAMGAMAQSLNSAYYTEDYKFRHDLNPAMETTRTIYPFQLWAM